MVVLLRVRIRCADSISVSEGGTISSVRDGAARDATLRVGDRVIGATLTTDPLPSQISIWREDATLAAIINAYSADSGESELSTRCFRLIKLPLRRAEDGALGLEMAGMRVHKITGNAAAERLMAVDDVVVSVNGRKVEVGSSLSALLKHMGASPIIVLTVLRRCPEHDLVTAQAVSTMGNLQPMAVSMPTAASSACDVPVTSDPALKSTHGDHASNVS